MSLAFFFSDTGIRPKYHLQPNAACPRQLEFGMKSFEERIASAKAKADNLIAQQARQVALEEEARCKAIAASIDQVLEELSDREKMRLFKLLEEKATARNRKLIERHPSRPRFEKKEEKEEAN